MATAGDRIRDLPLATAPSSAAFTYLIDSTGDSKADRAAMQNWLQTNSDSSLRFITTQAQLTSALAEAGTLILRLGANITLPAGSTLIPKEKSIEFNNFKFVKGSGSTLLFHGMCIAERQQIFSGFNAGDIIGIFGRTEIYPEWWGLQTDRHDIAINCAIQSSTRAGAAGLTYPDWHGTTVSLGPRIYYVARPIDCTGGYINIRGSGSAQTSIITTSAWVADTWEQAEIWGNPALNVPNHAAVIWIGGVYVGAGASNGATYRNQVTGVLIDCGPAGFALRTTNKRISGISSKSGVEECSIIDEVVITYATGFGIGFCRHRNADGNYYPATVNGLSITNFWIYGATYSDYYGMYFSAWTNNCRVDTGTVAGGLSKSISSQWNVNTSITPPGVGFDTTSVGPTIYTDPIWIRTYPQTGIYTSGANVSLSNIHIESSVVGILVAQADAASNVTINNVKVFGLMDRARNPVYMFDGISGLGAAPADNGTVAHYYGYGCGVLIAWYSEASRVNFTGRCTINNLYAAATTYLLRDSIYNVHLSAFGMGEYATTPSGAGVGGLMSFYTRGNIYRVQNIGVTGASGNGTTATLTFATQTIAIPGIGSTITVAGISPSGYNGSYVVTASSATSVSYLNTTTTSYSSGGTIGVKLEYNTASPPTDRTYFLGPIF
jgi:hypothetical protein